MMRNDGDCGCGGDGARSTHEMLLTQQHYCREGCDAHNTTSSGARSSRAVLREENLWLIQQLAIADARTRHLQERVHQLRRHAKTLQLQRVSEKEQWKESLEQRQRQWTDEYDRHMQSLLGIIAHHEANQTVMQQEIETLRLEKEKMAVIKSISVMREQATQTEEGEPEYEQCGGGCHYQHAIITPADTPIDPRDSFPQKVPSVRGELSVAEETPSIHEQYVALTMQKLLEQLRLSNNNPASAASLDTAFSSASEEFTHPTFRESVYKRLGSNGSPAIAEYLHNQKSPDISKLQSTPYLLQTLPAIHEESGDMTRGRLLRDSTQRRSQPAA